MPFSCAAFDLGFITVADDGATVVSDALDEPAPVWWTSPGERVFHRKVR
ncbi:hypothetical protein [Stigmatella hybrida]|nr:hypothetical protein [Stigmatella hybrida]